MVCYLGITISNLLLEFHHQIPAMRISILPTCQDQRIRPAAISVAIKGEEVMAGGMNGWTSGLPRGPQTSSALAASRGESEQPAEAGASPAASRIHWEQQVNNNMAHYWRKTTPNPCGEGHLPWLPT